jgi:hypothetical protein
MRSSFIIMSSSTAYIGVVEVEGKESPLTGPQPIHESIPLIAIGHQETVCFCAGAAQGGASRGYCWSSGNDNGAGELFSLP